MTFLFYAGHTQHISVLLDEAICLNKLGNKVYFLYNDCCTKICSASMWQNSIECRLCHIKMQKSLSLLPNEIEKINLTQFWSECNKHFEYYSAADIKTIKYKNVIIGYGVLSSYYSSTRNLHPLIDSHSKKYFDLLLNVSCSLIDSIENAIDTFKPDRIVFWNARYFDSRPLYDVAKNKGIVTISMERTNDLDSRNCKCRFINHTPHDIQYNQERLINFWNNSHYSDEDKYQIGRDFFERRRNGIAAGDKVYTAQQIKGAMPNGWDATKKNIVIFNSSEDEYAAIGDEYDALSLFPSQYQGIKYILECMKNKRDYHIYLRIHPNLTRVKYRYHTELLKLQDCYKNLTVIPASDKVSSYTLMDAAEKVVVFGSTMGMEAVYWRKPVILLAGACYYYSNICYIPNSKNELAILLNKHLEPKDNTVAIKWGFYIMYRNPEDYAKYVDIDKDYFRIFKYKFENIHCYKILGSSKLFAIYLRLVRIFKRKHITFCDVPLKEDPNAEL